MQSLKMRFALAFLSIAAVIYVAVLPGLTVVRAALTPQIAAQKLSSQGVDSAQQKAMQKLYTQLKAGDPFSEEEAKILLQFGEGLAITSLEADTVISRALYNYYIAGAELTKEQEELLDLYSQFVAFRSTDVSDLKTQLLNRRISAAIAALPRTTPLVAPANDLCSGAEVIPGAGPFPYSTAITGDISDATTTGDPAAPSCQTSVSRSIWYSFTPATTADYIISTCADAPTNTTVDDTVMGIYTSTGSCAGPFTEIPTGGASTGCNDDGCGAEAFQSVIQSRLNGGTQYLIVVWQFGTSPPTAGNTAVQLQVRQIANPLNDICSGAVALSLNTPISGTTAAAGADYQLSGTTCFTGVGNVPSTAAGRDVVYSFTAPATANYSFNVTGYNAVNNLVLYLSTSCSAPGTLTCSNSSGPVRAAANRQTGGTSESVNCVSLTTGQQVFVFVDENVVSGGGSFRISVTQCIQETEPNDTPATATAVSFGIEGSINPASNADFYSLGTFPAGSRVFAIADGVAANNTDFDMRVTTTVDTLEYDDGNNDALFGSLAPNVAGTPTTGTSTFLRLNRNGATSASEPYRIYSIVQPPSSAATVENEPNGTIETANSASNNYFAGALAGPAPSIDEDIYAFTAQAGDVVFLSLDSDPLRDNTPMNGALELLDSGGVTLISVNDTGTLSSTTSGAGSLDATTPSSPAEGLLFQVAVTGTYYAKVSIGTSFANPTGSGDYLLSIAKTASSPSPGTDTIGLFEPAGSGFFLRNSNSVGVADITFPYGPGAAGWIPIAGDWNGDGADSIGLYNPSNGAFYLRNSNNTGFADIIVTFGPAGAGWKPLTGDWNGDGTDTIGLYNPNNGVFYLRNTNTIGVADITFSYGPVGQGWLPLAGDWNGDGVDTVGLYNPSNSAFYLRNSNTVGNADTIVTFGPAGSGWNPIVGDWDGDGDVTIGLYNPSNSVFYLRNSNSFGVADVTFLFGPANAGWTPLVGNWDGL